jgi:hypothetical protein
VVNHSTPDPAAPVLRADIADTMQALDDGKPLPDHVQRHEQARLQAHRERGDWDETPQEAARYDRWWGDNDYDIHRDEDA